jgi:hypothetical protein
MQIALGIHALLGIVILGWAFRVKYELTPDLLFPGRPGFGGGLALVAWLLAWWIIARVRPMPSYRDQPESHFSASPAVILFVPELLLSAWFLASFSIHDSDGFSPYLVWAQIVLLLGGPVCLISWAGARIRYHVGTWILAWVVGAAGTVVAIAVIAHQVAGI